MEYRFHATNAATINATMSAITTSHSNNRFPPILATGTDSVAANTTCKLFLILTSVLIVEGAALHVILGPHGWS